ncbi:class I SAM-dependent methyltransferase [Luteimonas abyssi]|uniref:class I SAM-dependent methyltransferase n=1 Tax=Luteimonas abyssi TaxID=1247514 RepID=UPI000737D569|nr:methyltransferase regulatory domain-containing protein [Luteimonas abyssi]
MNAYAAAIDASADDLVGGVAYPPHFHREQMPLWLHATATALGHAAPDPSRPYRWCELGCGAGLTARVAAACNPTGHFTAIDMDAAQIARARAAAADDGLENLAFVEADLRDPALRDGAPFDFVVLHGVWAWVDATVRAAILALLQARLAPGGLVAVGYMSHPGASPLQGAQRLLAEAARHLEGDPETRVRQALGLLRALADAGAGFFAEHPGALRQLEAMERESPAYLVHEFLGAHWQPQHAADTIRAFAGTGCAFIGSATPIENIDALSVPAALQPHLRTLPPGPLAETARDLARNQSLRRDLFQRVQPGADAPHRLDPVAHLAALDALRFAALPGAPAAADHGLRLDTRIGPVDAPGGWVGPVLRALADGPQRFEALRRLPPFAEAPGLLNQVLQLLMWAGHVHPLHAAADTADMSHAFAMRAPSAPADGLQRLPAAGTAVPAGAARAPHPSHPSGAPR